MTTMYHIKTEHPNKVEANITNSAAAPYVAFMQVTSRDNLTLIMRSLIDGTLLDNMVLELTLLEYIDTLANFGEITCEII